MRLQLILPQVKPAEFEKPLVCPYQGNVSFAPGVDALCGNPVPGRPPFANSVPSLRLRAREYPLALSPKAWYSGFISARKGSRMELLFETTKHFEKDLQHLSAADRGKVCQRINAYGHLYLEDEAEFVRRYPCPKIKLVGDLAPSLYTLRVSENLRAIITFDKDPLFDQLIMTLLRLVKPDEHPEAFASVTQSLYQSHLVEMCDVSGEVVDGRD